MARDLPNDLGHLAEPTLDVHEALDEAKVSPSLVPKRKEAFPSSLGSCRTEYNGRVLGAAPTTGLLVLQAIDLVVSAAVGTRYLCLLHFF